MGPASERYDIEVRRELSGLVRGEFPDVEIAVEGGNTHLITRVLDQAGLYGLIGRLEALGLTMLSVRPMAPEELPERNEP